MNNIEQQVESEDKKDKKDNYIFHLRNHYD